ncbi:1-deoxy-D-xylulose 5-phosphate reductoisomerase [Asticcacaulis biprosthecium C19]|uniref:1-deoxy-D-xylulose 5-phosphate reductoisomerase n=1 Tax=Asticcacaulis biprosthecium C19 TaxID=715226 RepID=F4QQM1_9CAUL|nr:1-deoxy-D-xylulose-5-phosphate reductoisomerase [Asticcacaulis biprosthecium]EGF90508.1 1-deoxy-D-xylulose 5-phosphate reductoisomerase [Asticcacaulis biprosthecium C19]
MTRRISILGSTGSIGVSTLRLLDEAGGDFAIEALIGGRNVDLLAEQALKYRPAVTVLADPSQWPAFRDRLAGSGLDIACGEDAVCAAAGRKTDLVMAAIVGIAGLKPTWAAAATGATLALANKESLVCCGRALIDRVEAHGGRVLPVDSEHNAIFQVLDATQKDKISRLILTASGGPFFGRTRAELAQVTVEQALKHPNWSMGAKITIDSATLANKGLELIEAAYLFDMPGDKIDVVIHPQSVVHSLVEYRDGSSLAQLGPPDMRVPISYCLGWPDRVVWQAPRLDLVKLANLSFSAPDENAFPMLRLARQALEAGEGMTTVFNAANEICVQAFLDRRIGFLQIADYVETAMMRAQLPTISSKDHISRDMSGDRMTLVLEIDVQVRSLVQDLFVSARQHV